MSTARSSNTTIFNKLFQPGIIKDLLAIGSFALVIGIITSASIWLFKWLIQYVQQTLFQRFGLFISDWLGHWAVMIIPVIGGLLVGLLFLLLKNKNKLFGVPEVMSAVALQGGKLRLVEAPLRVIGAVLSIGSGASVGPEDPSVHIGANLASYIGQRFNLSTERLRSAAAAGSAAAIAAAFNAPIAGVFFALEVLLSDITGSSLSLVVLSSVISSAFTRWFSGSEPAFHIPTYTIHSAWEVLLYIILGLAAGLTAAALTIILDKTRQVSNASNLPGWIKPAIAGLVVGTAGIWLPQLFGTGYNTIDSVLNSAPQNLWVLLLLIAAKLILTPVSLAGGFQGGVIAPSLFLGAILGAAFGEICNVLFPTLGLAPAAFALVGMAAVLAASIHAPLMAILLLFEMTNDYRILLPLMAVVVISVAIKRRVIPESVYTLTLARQGIYIEHGRDAQVMAGITVGEVMETNTPRLYDYNTIRFARDLMVEKTRQGLPVFDEEENFIGVLTISDIQNLDVHQNPDLTTVGEVCTTKAFTVTPEVSLDSALHVMAEQEIGRLPVVDSQNPNKLVGWLRRADLIRAYEIGLARRAALRQTAESNKLGQVSGLHVEEIQIMPDSICEGRKMQQIPWPTDSLVVSIRRGSRVMIPHGDNELRAGDILVIAMEESAAVEVQRLTSSHRDR